MGLQDLTFKFGSLFLHFETRYRVPMSVLGYEAYWSRKRSNIVNVQLNTVNNIASALGSSNSIEAYPVQFSFS